MRSTATNKTYFDDYSDIKVEDRFSEFVGKANSFSISPRGDNYRSTAVDIRRAARINAASIDEKEHKLLLRQRALLVEKKFSPEGLTSLEERKLNFVRWSLDRISDAQTGAALDALESAVEQYENFAEEIRSLAAQLNSFRGKSGR